MKAVCRCTRSSLSECKAFQVKLSVVATLYRSSSTIDEFVRRSLATAEAVTRDVELVLVNDGSPDDSFECAMKLHRADPRIVIVDLSRNFGHHKAMMTGLKHASGDLIFLIDSDLEEEPELLTKFHERFMQGDCDVVYGVQQTRRGGFFERVSGDFFFRLTRLLSREAITLNTMNARLMTRAYVSAVVRHRDREFLIANLFQLAGFRQIAMPVRKLSSSPSTYSIGMRMEMAIKYITTTSPALLYGTFYIGLATCALAALFILYILGRYVTSGIGISGYTSIIVSIWFFGGLITLALGILSIYIANILSETKRRPYVVIRKVFRESATAGNRPESLLRADDGQAETFADH